MTLDVCATARIRQAALARIVAHARDEAPRECCGILLGRGDLIERTWPAGNLATDPNRFLVDPGDHFAARRLAREQRLSVLGFYHSHPHGAARPSETDLAEASYPGLLYLIVSLADGGDARVPGREPCSETRAYRFEPPAFVDVTLTPV